MAKISGKIYEWCAFKIDTFIDNDDCDELRALADRIDAEMVELPRDRDGVPIHVGDTVYGEDGRAWHVEGVSIGRGAKCDEDHVVHAMGDSGQWRDLMPEWLTHTRPDSWERIANELDAWVDRPASYKEHKEFHTFAERIRKLAKKED